MNDSNKEKPSSEADERPTGKPSEGEGEQPSPKKPSEPEGLGPETGSGPNLSGMAEPLPTGEARQKDNR